jgi:hypothetical protein
MEYTLDKRLGGPQNRSGWYVEEKNLAPVEDWTPAVQPVSGRYTNWAIATPKNAETAI